MKLSDSDLNELLETAVKAALEAGKVIRYYTDKKIDVIEKTGGESKASQVVTEVDFKSQEVILSYLNPTIKQFDLALLTEESVDDYSRFQKDYFWCIDPIDGTLPFIEHTHGYSVSIGLVAKDGTPFIGVIYDPLKDILYSAAKGFGLFRNGELWQWNASVNMHLTFVQDKSFFDFPDYNGIQNKVISIANEQGLDSVKTIAQGGAALNACWVLENSPAFYFKFPKDKPGSGSLWDFAASACIFNEANAVVKSFKNDKLDLNRKDSTFMNHEGAIFATNKDLASKIKNLY